MTCNVSLVLDFFFGAENSRARHLETMLMKAVTANQNNTFAGQTKKKKRTQKTLKCFLRRTAELGDTPLWVATTSKKHNTTFSTCFTNEIIIHCISSM